MLYCNLFDLYVVMLWPVWRGLGRLSGIVWIDEQCGRCRRGKPRGTHLIDETVVVAGTTHERAAGLRGPG